VALEGRFFQNSIGTLLIEFPQNSTFTPTKPLLRRYNQQHCCRPAGGCRRKPETYDQQSDSGARRRESGGKASPGLGEHNDEVSKELGFELNEIERLSASGVIAKPAAPGKAA
jgi:hypothetical protein